MKYGKIAGVPQPVSRAVMGSLIFSPEKKELTFSLLDAFAALGGNCIDTAHIYNGGKSEAAIGLWLDERGNRESIVVLDKGCAPTGPESRVTPECIRADLADNRARLKTSYVDLWVLHRDNPAVPVGPIVEELNAQKAAGKMRAFGGSNWTHTRIQEANEYAYKKGLTGFAVSSPNLSLAEPKEAMWAGCISVSAEGCKWHAENQFPLFAWSSQARGFFSGRFGPGRMGLDPDVMRVYYNAENFERLRRAQEMGRKKNASAIQIAFAYVFNQPFPAYCLFGPANPDELNSSLAAVEIGLTPEELKWLNLEANSITSP